MYQNSLNIFTCFHAYIAIVCSILDGIAYSASLNDGVEKTTKHSFLVLVFILPCLPKAVFIEIFKQNRLSFELVEL